MFCINLHIILALPTLPLLDNGNVLSQDMKDSIKGRWKKMEIQHRLRKSVNKLQKLSTCLPLLILLPYSNYWACN